MRARVVVLLLVSGCIQSRLVPCGDLDCPAGDLCLAASMRCVTADQLVECSDRADGADCIVGTSAGRCRDGACTPASCGNGVLEAGEVCDDGNQESGDGCSGTCDSTEQCGNGVVDVAAGEGCDCGDAAHPSVLCAHPNSDDPTAECSAQCKPRFCGDGQVSTIEQCDGSVPSNRSCSDFGYYAGSLTCSAVCQLSPTQCTGRCGDGVIDVDHGEYCDGVVPVDASCLRFGYDLGPLHCATACGPSLDSCHQLAFERIHSVQDTVQAISGGHGLIGVIYASQGTWALQGPISQRAPASYLVVATSATKVWAAGTTHVASWTAAAGWSDSASVPWTTPPTSVWASDTLGVYVSDGTTAWHYNGTTWTTVTGPWASGAGIKFGRAESALWVLAFPKAFTWNGTAWTEFTTLPNVDASVEDGTGRLYVTSNLSLYRRRDDGAFDMIGFSINNTIVAAPRGVYGIRATVGPAIPPLLHLDIGEPFAIPRPQQSPIGSDGTMPLLGFSTGLHAVTHGAWVGIAQHDPQFLPHVQGGPLLTFIGSSTTWSKSLGDGGTQAITVPATGCSEAVMSAAGRLYCLAASSFWDGPTQVTLQAPRALWVKPDDTVAAVVGVHSFAYKDSGGWHGSTPAISFYELDGTAVNDLYAIALADGDTTNKLFHFNGTTWTALTAAQDGLAVTPTKVWARRTSGGVSYDRTTMVATPVTFPVPFGYLVHADGEQLWGAVAGFTAPNISPLWRYNGTEWFQVRIPVDLSSIDGLSPLEGGVVVSTFDSFNVVYGKHWLAQTASW